MRIAYIGDPISANGFYRAVAPMTELANLRGHRVQRLLHEDGRPAVSSVRGVDVVYIHRHCDQWAQQVAAAAKAAGAALLWDDDDDLSSVPRTLTAYRRFGGIAWDRRLAAMRKIFRHADLVTAPSQTLADRLSHWGAPQTGVTDNYLVDQQFAFDRRPHQGFVIGWLAGKEHAIDAERMPIVAQLQRLLDERDDVRVVTIGLRLDLQGPKYEHLAPVALQTIPRYVSGFDVAIAPLADLAFNRARSNIKLKEYAAAGTPWLASPIGPYVGMGERQGGQLVADDQWYSAISTLIDKPRLRRKLSKRGAKWAAEQTIAVNLDVWENLFTRLAAGEYALARQAS